MIKAGDKRAFHPESGNRDYADVTAVVGAVMPTNRIEPLTPDSKGDVLEIPIGSPHYCWEVKGPNPTADSPTDYLDWLRSLEELAPVRFVEK